MRLCRRHPVWWGGKHFENVFQMFTNVNCAVPTALGFHTCPRTHGLKPRTHGLKPVATNGIVPNRTVAWRASYGRNIFRPNLHEIRPNLHEIRVNPFNPRSKYSSGCPQTNRRKIFRPYDCPCLIGRKIFRPYGRTLKPIGKHFKNVF